MESATASKDRREYQHEYYLRNKERLREKRALQYLEKKSSLKPRQKNEEEKLYQKQYQKEYKKKNKETLRAYWRQYYQLNKEKIRLRRKKIKEQD